MCIIIGIVGRICSGKQSLSWILKQLCNEYEVQIKQIDAYDIEEIFTNVLEKQNNFEELEQYLIEYANKIKEFTKKQTALCKQAFLDWVGWEKDLSNLSLEKSSEIKEFKSRPQILYPIVSYELFQYMNKRNYFHLIAIDAPSHMRYTNFIQKYPKFKEKIDFQTFIMVDDILFYNSEIEKCYHISTQYIVNKQQGIKYFIHNNFKQGGIDFSQYRPNFDQYYMEIAFTVKKRSNCMKRAVGAVLTKNQRILSTGYNGTPQCMKNCFEGGCERCNSNASQGQDLAKCLCIHAEASSILESGVQKAKGATLYTTLFPCIFCAKIIMHAGISRVVYAIDYDGNASAKILHGVTLDKVQPLSGVLS